MQIPEIMKEAKEIETYANSFYHSDRELQIKAEKFKAKWRINWYEIV